MASLSGSASQQNNTGLIDAIINKLLRGKITREESKGLVTEADIRLVCRYALDVFKAEDTLLKVRAPITLCGDVHGQFVDLKRIFEMGGAPAGSSYLFLGDYVDRGRNSIEVIMLLLCYKIRYPQTFHILRGNHEYRQINSVYGFQTECQNKYGKAGDALWTLFCDLFDYFPLAAVIDSKIFCCHGGLSPDMKSIRQVDELVRPITSLEKGLACDLVWADPDDELEEDFGKNKKRNISYVFSASLVQDFLYHNKLDLVVRAHECVDDGHLSFANDSLITLFSAPGYEKKKNIAAIMLVDANLQYSFKQLKPE